MKIAITGATGMIGNALSKSLQTDGHEVLAVSRSGGQDRVQWNLESGTIESEKLAGCEAIVNLAGSSIAQRWNDSTKDEILNSRIKATRLITKTAIELEPRPRALVSASAIGYYGPHPGQPVDESAPPGNGFLADVCKEWEAATQPAEDAGIRVAHVRIGVVLSPEGGALAKMLTPFKAGLGGPVGSGKQMLSWISLDDLVGVFRHCLEDDRLSGPVNATAPNPVSNAAFADSLGAALGRPAVIPAPAFAIKLAFGDMAEETVLADQTVQPLRLQETGFDFQQGDIQNALKDMLK